jgi:inactivated superfamily I helicase
MEPSRPRVFSIPPGCPFLPTLIEQILEGRVLPGLHDLSDATLYLPTRRAARALSALLAERAGGRALLLPRIVALGEQRTKRSSTSPATAPSRTPPCWRLRSGLSNGGSS